MSPDGPAALRLEAVTRVYGSGATAVRAVDSASLELAPSDVVAIVGPSGSGKTTLLQLAGGIDRPTDGRVVIAGQDVAALNDNALTELRRKRIGFVFQFFNLVPALSAEDNVALPLRLDGVERREARERSRALLTQVGLGERLEHRPSTLSGGEQQRVAIARALVGEPQLVLADEPTGNLDGSAGEQVVRLLVEAARERGAAVLIVTHDDRVLPHVDRVLRMADGRLADEVAAPSL